MDIEGKVVDIYYEEGDFFIFSLLTDKNERKKAKANLPAINLKPGLEISISGEWETHPEYGPTFNADQGEPLFRSEQPTIKWLWIHLDSVEPFQARKMVERYGPRDLTDRLDEGEWEFLHEDGVIDEKSHAQAIQAEFEMATSKGKNSTLLMDMGVPASKIDAVYSSLGEEAAEEVKENPYVLLDVPGFPFRKADEVALRSGIDRDADLRCQSAIIGLLQRAQTLKGDLFLWRSTLLDQLNGLPKYLDVPSFNRNVTEGWLDAQLERLYSDGRILRNDRRVYLRKNFEVEYRSAEKICELVEGASSLDVDTEQFIDEYEQTYQIELSDKQAEAVHSIKDNQVLLLTGLPGTGKTTLVKTLCRLFRETDVSFDLMCPTGIAAKKLSSVTDEDAGTIHRILGYDGDTWDYGPDQKYNTDAVIVDECSMLDQELFYRLISSLDNDTRVIFVGDPAQLPSVGAGNVLHELIESEKIKQIHLTHIFRQAEQSDIVINAHSINRGEMPDLQDPKEKSTDFRFIQSSDLDAIQSKVVGLAEKLYFEASDDLSFQVLSPTYKGMIGVDSLNNEIKRRINPPGGKIEKDLKGQSFREGDRIMVTRNDYRLGVYNGEQGKVEQIDRKEGHIRGRIFDHPHDKMVDFDFARAGDLLTLAYAMTIHKCVTPDTIVETERGLLRIDEIGDTGSIAAPDGMKEYGKKVENPPMPVIDLRTNRGYGLTVTEDHGVDVWDGEGYVRKRADRVEEGDFLRFRMSPTCEVEEVPELPDPTSGDVREETYPVPDRVTPDFAEFMGMMVSDGTVYDRGFRLVKRHQDVVDRFGHLSKRVFGCSPKEAALSGDLDAAGAAVNSTFLARWIQSLGCVNPNDKCIPGFILRSPLSVQKRFLRGLFTDGTVNMKEGRIDHISLCQKNDRILRLAQIMLLRMGIVSNLTSPPSKSTSLLSVYGGHIERFHREIGFISDFKDDRLKQGSVGSSREDVIPFSEGEIRDLWERYRSAFPEEWPRNNAVRRGYLSRDVFSDIYSRIREMDGPIDWVESRLGWYHGRVSEMEESVSRTMCVEVPDGNQFLQNGCSGWNSQGKEWDCVIFPFHETFTVQLQRNLLYTAVTRAKDKVFIFGQKKALRQAVNNDEVEWRNSQFSRWIKRIC